ncbi:MAG: mannose-1-phosphate guanylyltransferase [Candidatus Doudnabacteria bacterium]|nr:mannose-1-phosphate guanylyltransferase [Candidatus Doudnabacteria bacterium]
MKILIVAGGQGTKMWPYSRTDKPKQFQKIVGEETPYENNINTLLKEFPAEDIFVSTKRKFIKYVSEQSPQIPLKNYIIEPDIAKDRGPGEGLAFLRLSMVCPGEPFFMVQSDCYREPAEEFLKMIRQAEKLVKKHKKLITGGIKATEPSIGVDYLQLGQNLDDDAYAIDKFVFRKDTMKETRELIQSFHVVTHCNHMCWYPELALEAYKKYRPDWYEKLMAIKEAIDNPGEHEAVERLYSEMEKGATEEVTTNVMDKGEAIVILLPFKWTDLGTWSSVYDYFSTTPENYEDGNVVSVDTTGSLIKSSHKDKLIAVAGVEDMVIVDTDDVLLVIPKEKIDKIKNIQAVLTERESTEYL